MTTIPARLARMSISSGSWPGTFITLTSHEHLTSLPQKKLNLKCSTVARARSRGLYRDWIRSANEIVTLYALNVPASAVKAKVRQEFERNLLVDDLQTVDILLLKGHQEYQVCLHSLYRCAARRVIE